MFIDKPRIKKVGPNVVFECTLQANPVGEVRWVKEGAAVAKGGRFKMSETSSSPNDHILSLEISGIGVADGGEYTVFVKNKHGESSANIKLNLGGKS